MRARILSTAVLLAATRLTAAPSPTPTPVPAAAGIRMSTGHVKHTAPAVARVPVAPAVPPESVLTIYRIETSHQGTLYAADHPMQAGDLVSFHAHPSGTLVSLRRSEIQHVVVEHVTRTARGPKPGDAIDIGVTGGGAASRPPALGGAGAGAGAQGAAQNLGSNRDGTALLNPDRKYQGDIDSKQVPGLNMGLPNSPNDYREGRTLGYPAAPAVQSAPGAPPQLPDSKPN
jgi:hypothetical protein